VPLFASPSSPWADDEILRAELFSSERLEQHAASLAVAQQVTRKRTRRRSLDARLKDNESVLLDAYRTIGTAVGEGRAITPAAEWLLDNYHSSKSRSARFAQICPRVSTGNCRAWRTARSPAFRACSFGVGRHRTQRQPLRSRFAAPVRARLSTRSAADHRGTVAVAITLRIVLVENLRRAASRIVGSRAARQDADSAADRLLGVNGFSAEPDALARRHAAGGSFPPAFVVQLVLRLRDQDPETTLPGAGWTIA